MIDTTPSMWDIIFKIHEGIALILFAAEIILIGMTISDRHRRSSLHQDRIKTNEKAMMIVGVTLIIHLIIRCFLFPNPL